MIPVAQLQILSLLEVLRRAPDPRGKNTRLRIGPGLAIVTMALLAGRREISEIARFAQTLSQAQRRQLGLPRKKGTKAFWQVPTYRAFFQVLTRLNAEAFARLLGRMAPPTGRPPAAGPGPGRQDDPGADRHPHPRAA